jgi:hypothetical protein
MENNIINPDPENENPENIEPVNEEETPLDETGADHLGSNNTDENSEGRKEGKSFYEKLRETNNDKSEEQKQ